MVQKISKERLERSLAEDENLSKLTNTTKNWLRQNIVKDNDVKATNKTEKAADKLINTKSKGIINWVKDNPIETLPVESNLTEMTEKEISEEISLSFGVEQTNLSIEQELILHGLSEKLQLDPLLCIEMASFHEKSSIAIYRTTKIKNYFEKQGIDQKRFDVIWHDSEKESKIQLKLFQNDINH